MYTYLDSFILLCLLFRWRKKPTGNCFPLLFWRFFGFALLHIPQCFHKFFTITLGPESKRSKNQLKPSKCSIITRFKTASAFFFDQLTEKNSWKCLLIMNYLQFWIADKIWTMDYKWLNVRLKSVCIQNFRNSAKNKSRITKHSSQRK